MNNDHPLADMPTTRRIDCVLAILSGMPVQRPGGWTTAELAELCGCSEAAIVIRQREALAKLKRRIPELREDLKPSTN